ncbi:MAG TPA: asparagine synthase (glutamine-hydrolyzing), partial [Polyangiaceae bacterium]|nr:asparagine synthase (glutamine-hydrolyzing) [Polyangiaceae bacterium]
MCGIAGYIRVEPGPDVLARMLRRIEHRGPDGQGVWQRQVGRLHVNLGHRRLSIIDLATGGQPMANEDESLVLTFNGEIYNYLTLRKALEARGLRFRTRSDTETILRQFEQHGVEGITELDGMFAFAIWDSRSRKLVLARDRMGIKPLYYAELAGGGIAFASELSAILAMGEVDGGLSVDGLVSYFFSDYVHPPHAIVRGVKKLPPGHTLIWQDGRFEAPRAFWSIPKGSNLSASFDEELAASLWSRLGDAVESQLVADVPVGIFLSGGIDSSCVAALAAQRAGKRMKAFSIGFDDATFDESSYARLVASRLDVEHVTETLHEGNVLGVVDDALDKLDEPLADPSLLPTYLLSRLAARHVKVVVGGDGGDELWGGYPTYRAHRYAALYARLPVAVRAIWLPKLIDRLPVDDRYQSLEWKLRR